MKQNTLRTFSLSLAMAVGSLGFVGDAHADVTHVVGKGQSIDKIAMKYRVPVKSILEKNRLANGKLIHPGDSLVIPGVSNQLGKVKKGATAKDGRDVRDPKDPKGLLRNDPNKGKTPAQVASTPTYKGKSFAANPKTPGVLRASHLGEEHVIRVRDRNGRIPPPAMRQFEKLMRSGTAMRPIDPRLIALLGMVSDHFGGRKLELVSGYRPFSPTQYTQHSNHNLGRAIDFKVEGVPNEAVRDFCKHLRNVGVGYYPNSHFVHLDVRAQPAFWVDYSRPGEPPRYDRPNSSADEGTTDVPDTAHPHSHPAPPPTGSTAPIAPQAKPPTVAPPTAPTTPAPAPPK